MIGKRVTCRVREEAFYSRYAGNPEVWFEPGDVGIVHDCGIPYVYHRPGRPATYCTVDFERNGRVWRVGLASNNIKGVK